jgi:hypothetical protein
MKKLLEIIPENGEPIRKTELHEIIREKKEKWGKNKKRINDHLNLMCQQKKIKKKTLKHIRGSPVEYSKQSTEEIIRKAIENSPDAAVTQYLQMGPLLSKINKLLLMNTKEYAESEQKNTRDYNFRNSLENEIVPLINKLTMYVKENDFEDNSYRCLLGDFNFFMRYNNYENDYYDTYLTELFDNRSPHHYILLKTKYKDVEDKVLPKTNKKDNN